MFFRLIIFYRRVVFDVIDCPAKQKKKKMTEQLSVLHYVIIAFDHKRSVCLSF